MAIALLLFAAAGLKFYGLAASPVSPQGIFATASFQVALVEFELFLALWLLSGMQPIGSWFLAAISFSTFAAVSFYHGWLGHASCGCFGKLLVNPWIAFGIDLAAVVALLAGRPDFHELWTSPRAVISRLAVVSGAAFASFAAVALLLLGLAHFRFGSVDAALAAIRGETMSLSPVLLDVGDGDPGEERESTLTVFNYSENVVRIIGGSSDCSCVVTKDLPVSIPAQESRSITVMVRLPGKPGIFTRKALLWTDADEARKMRFSLTGRTVSPALMTSR